MEACFVDSGSLNLHVEISVPVDEDDSYLAKADYAVVAFAVD